MVLVHEFIFPNQENTLAIRTNIISLKNVIEKAEISFWSKGQFVTLRYGKVFLKLLEYTFLWFSSFQFALVRFDTVRYVSGTLIFTCAYSINEYKRKYYILFLVHLK